jgi:uncharacterized protein YecE (DUF72 family)
MKYRIGCSGFYYPQWKNKFYPPDVQPRNWLAHYSSIFNTVELNGTFYKMPTIETLKRFANSTPDDFKFSVKMSRFVTHRQRLKLKTSITEFQSFISEGLGEKLLHFLFQMPPSFQFSGENLERVIENIPNAVQNVIEFRHASWWNETTAKVLTKAGITFCNIDFPGLNTYFINTSPAFYLRLHGNPELFISPYNDQQLEYYYQQFPKEGTCTVYFNNTMTEAGFQNALHLIELTNEIHA